MLSQIVPNVVLIIEACSLWIRPLLKNLIHADIAD